MLFNSYEFVFGFLPITLAVFFFIGKLDRKRLAVAWLVGASLFFYGWWNAAFVSVILFSILFNYFAGLLLGRRHQYGVRWQLAICVAVNLALLGYFKYANFFLDNVGVVTGTYFHLETVVLPLAISFFTFQQIAYLVDASRGGVREHDFLHYCLFVCFFPQLIAGPIVHHKEMLPQFAQEAFYRFNPEKMAIGVTIFTLGLFKKVGLADRVAPFSTNVFTAVENGLEPSLLEAWGAALAYTLQLYFDFSGYSDMAIGLGFMFGIVLPLNFNSPYKAKNIIEFWRRWHMTLSRFLCDYIYIPLGGNRKGPARRHVNLLITMILGGLWHGAGWTFLAWGALHGFYLVTNHGWRTLCRRIGWHDGRFGIPGKAASGSVTFLAVVVAWVFFRAESFDGALEVLQGMAGGNGVGRTLSPYFGGFNQALLLAILLASVFILPNTLEIVRSSRQAQAATSGRLNEEQRNWITWKPNKNWAFLISALALLSFAYISKTSEFLYYQF